MDLNLFAGEGSCLYVDENAISAKYNKASDA